MGEERPLEVELSPAGLEGPGAGRIDLTERVIFALVDT